jgi:saccharopine dehydrogenase-like NADP-dependent oxidoreductase
MSDVTVVIGAGQIGQAIARRVSPGKHVLLADLQLRFGNCRDRLRSGEIGID